MLSACAAVASLAAMGAVGSALLRRFRWTRGPLEELAYGLPLGIVISSLALLVLASVFGKLSAGLVIAVTIAAAAAAAALGGPVSKSAWMSALRSRPWPAFALILFLALTVRWVFLFHSTLPVEPSGLYAGHVNIWGDWSEHLGDVTSFAYGDNFPPSHPRIAGLPFAYHYLTSITVAGMVALGMDPLAALPLHSFLMSILVALAVFAFARRLTGGSSSAALTVLLFLVGGGLGWVLQARQLIHAPAGTALLREPWDAAAQQTANYRWLNVYFSLIYPQRSFLYGLPLGLLTISLLMSAVADRSKRALFVVAGLVAGLLPFAHLGTFLSLALITPFLFLLFPSMGWFAFLATWVVVAVPQIWIQQGGGPGAAGAIRFHWGWVAGNESWVWFWLKNLGAFVPLLLLALWDRELLGRTERRVLWAFMPVFVAANLIAFQPWDWDNSKVLAYWFLAVCVLASALLMKMWREFPGWPVRAFLVATIVTMTLSGALENLNQLLGRDRHLLLTREELDLARAVRDKTEPHAIFAAGLQHNHPISMLAGRRVITSFPGWMWSQGATTTQRERDLRRIMTLAPDARDLIARYHVDYVVIGPNETDKLEADRPAFQKAFPEVIESDRYAVFDVRGQAPSASSAATSADRTRRE